MRIYGTYTPTKWDKVTIDVVEYLMFYSLFDPEDMYKAQAQYVGQIQIIGELQGKTGSFVVTDNGTFNGGVAISELSIIPGSGTGELTNISGIGEYAADQKGCTWEMEVFL